MVWYDQVIKYSKVKPNFYFESSGRNLFVIFSNARDTKRYIFCLLNRSSRLGIEISIVTIDK